MTEKENMHSRYKDGMTWRSFLAVCYGLLVFQPTMIYLYLLTGSPVASTAIQYATLILFAELARASGNPLTKQEACWIIIGTPVAGLYQWILLWMYQGYFKFSPTTYYFGIMDKIPYFYSPVTEDAWLARTFWHPHWYPILGVSLLWLALIEIAGTSLGLIARHLYVEVEKLPFPLSQPTATMVKTLTEERESSRLAIIGAAALISLVYSLILYGIPMVATTWGYQIQLLPIPWTDYNYQLHRIIPGASLGFATDPAFFASGLLIPLNVIVGMVISSFAIYFVGNGILVRNELTFFGKEWFAGMSVANSWQRSFLYAWFNPFIGLALALGIMPLFTRPRVLIDSLKPLVGLETRTKALVSVWKAFLTFLIGSVAIACLDAYLAPDFPIWLFFLMDIGFFFVYTLIVARAAGEAVQFNVPYVEQLSIIASGYTGSHAWFVPFPLWYEGGAWAQNFKVGDLTETHPISLLKALLISPISLLMAFWFISAIWRTSPIPSERFPGIQAFWPMNAATQGFLISRPPGLFLPQMILAGFGVGAMLYLMFGFLLKMSTSPLIGAVVGVATPIPQVLTMLIGALLGGAIQYVFGKKWWDENRALIAAGIMLGEGILITVAGSIALIIISMWAMNY